MKTVVVHMADVKEMVYKILRENKSSGDSNLDHYLRPAAQDTTTRQLGRGLNRVHDFSYEDDGHTRHPSTSEALHWMDYGFTSKAMLNSATRVPLGFETRPSWNEDEGDIDVGRLAAGYDDFFLGRTEQHSKPGIQLRFDCWFSAGVPNTVISEYGRWIMQLIAGIESMGYDLTIDSYCVTDRTFENSRERTAIAIRVKNQSESNDMTAYSCLFSPIGTRVLAFTAMAAAAKKSGTRVTSFFGQACSDRKWDLQYDTESGIVSVTGAQVAAWRSGSKFPGKELTEKAVAAKLIPEQ